MANRWKPGELVIEFRRPKSNGYVMFKPLGQRIRCVWSASNQVSGSIRTGFHTLPDIPGQYVALDVNSRTVRVIDPLGFRENKQLLAKIHSIIEPWLGKMRPVDTGILTRMDDTTIKTVLYEMMEWVEADKAKVIAGSMPPKEKILERKGSLRRRYFYCVEGQTPYASEEEIELLGEKDKPTMELVPAIE